MTIAIYAMAYSRLPICIADFVFLDPSFHVDEDMRNI